MPIGQKHALATFQRAMHVIFSSVKWQASLVYLEGIVIFSKPFEQHLNHPQRDLRILQDAGVAINLKKSFFFGATISHLGHVIHPGKLEVAESATDAIRQHQYPTTLT